MTSNIQDYDVRDLIADIQSQFGGDGSRWTRGALARTPAGFEVDPTSPNAVQWCLVGAARAQHGLGEGTWIDRPDAIDLAIQNLESLFDDPLETINDERCDTFEEVEAQLRAADRDAARRYANDAAYHWSYAFIWLRDGEFTEACNRAADAVEAYARSL
jgi:hypothetical protein